MEVGADSEMNPPVASTGWHNSYCHSDLVTGKLVLARQHMSARPLQMDCLHQSKEGWFFVM